MIEGAALGGGHQPGAGIGGNALVRPVPERRDQRLLRELLGQPDIADDAGQPGDQLGLLDAPDGVDRAVRAGAGDGAERDGAGSGGTARCSSLWLVETADIALHRRSATLAEPIPAFCRAAPHRPAGHFSPRTGRRRTAATPSPIRELTEGRGATVSPFSPFTGRRCRQADEGRRDAVRRPRAPTPCCRGRRRRHRARRRRRRSAR